MPEMKGRSLEELDEIFAARVPARKFKGYQCLIRDAARIDAVNAEGLQEKEKRETGVKQDL
jgi:hypothetical protein